MKTDPPCLVDDSSILSCTLSGPSSPKTLDSSMPTRRLRTSSTRIRCTVTCRREIEMSENRCEQCDRTMVLVERRGHMETFRCDAGHEKFFMVSPDVVALFGPIDDTVVDVHFVPSGKASLFDELRLLRALIPAFGTTPLQELVRVVRRDGFLAIETTRRPSARALEERAAERGLTLTLFTRDGG